MASQPTASDPSDREYQLRETWAPAHGFPGVLSEVNNQLLGMRFMITAFVFFLVGGILALLMRIQLITSHNDFLGPQVYNELFTMHGSTMMFLFAVPFLEGLALYLLPLMIGARDVAFPRLTAYGYWVYLFGGVIFYTSFLVGAVPDVGWFGYTPYSSAQFTGISTDFWLLGLSLVEVAGLTAGLEIVVTILKFRAPGMTFGRMPLLVWSFLVVGIMILVAFTVLLTATVLLELDRALDTAFFDVDRGGNNLLWQHLFWFFGHPEVYIMFLPAAGIISMIVPVAARRRISGYSLIVAAIVLTGFVSFGLWVHHMFAAGLPALSMTFFTAASLMIAIASGIQIFAWIATLWRSNPVIGAPLLYALGFVFLFVLGGLTGVMVAVVPFDIQVHDTYFIVAHMHYVMIGGVIFPVFAGLYFWFPKMSGRLMHPMLGKLSFWTNFIGFNLTFFPMHIMGFLGMPRRVYTYPRSLELDGYNLLATIGAFMMGLGVLLFLIDVIYSLMFGDEAGDDPWNGDSLEWSVPSPPPIFSFYTFPIVRSRHPVWDAAGVADPELEKLQQALTAEPQTWRGNLVTEATDSRPQAIQYLPGPTYLPLGAAVATSIIAIGILTRAYTMSGFGVIALFIILMLWLSPKPKILKMLRESYLPERSGLPVMSTGPRSTVWWGMICWLAMYASSFAALLYTYFYLRLFTPQWPPVGIPDPEVGMAALSYGFLIVGSVAQCYGLTCFRQKNWAFSRIAIGGAILCGAIFIAMECWEFWRVGLTLRTDAYSSIYFVLSWAVMISILVGAMLSLTAAWRFSRDHQEYWESMTLHLELASLQWGLTAGVGVLGFITLYLSPYFL